MPIRTWLPTISMTCTEMSSPSMIFSPGRRVMISIAGAYPPGGGGPLRPRAAGRRRSGRLLRRAGEQPGAHRGLGGHVDDLAALAAVDEQRGAQVGAEVLHVRGGAD